MIHMLSDQECFEFLTSTTVGRVGVIRDGRVLILPVNYALDGRDVIIRTDGEGILADAAREGGEIAVEVDHHNDMAGVGWSVLLHGSIGVADPEPTGLPTPWAGGGRDLTLRFIPSSMSGRSVRRENP